MKVDDRALPLTRRQLDIRLAQETGRSGTEWQLGLFVRIEGTVKPDLLEHVIRQAPQETNQSGPLFPTVPPRAKTRWLNQAVPTSKRIQTPLLNYQLVIG